MARNEIEAYQGQILLGKNHTLQVIESVAEAQRYRQLAPGKAHPCWLIGHMAFACDARGLKSLCGLEGVLDGSWREPFAPDFAGGQLPVADPDAYPSWEAVCAGYERVMDAFLAGLETLDDSQLDLPPLGGHPPARDAAQAERSERLFGTIRRTLNMLILHDSYHRGQLGLLAAMKD